MKNGVGISPQMSWMMKLLSCTSGIACKSKDVFDGNVFSTEVWDCLWALRLWKTGRQGLLPQEQQLCWCRGRVLECCTADSSFFRFVFTLKTQYLNQCLVYLRLKEDKICVSTDGPWDSVVKFKPPMCFSKEDAELVVQRIDHILTGWSEMAY